MPDLIGAKSQHIHGHSLKAKRWCTRLRWEFVDILTELKCRRNGFNDLFKDLSNKAFAIFQSQINHCFVTSLAFWKHNLSFIVFDQSGTIRCKPFNIHAEPALFLCLIIGMTWGSNTLIGLDPTIIKDNKREFITVHGQKLKIKQCLWRGDMIRGCVTSCYLVYCAEQDIHFVIKDCWIIRGHAPTKCYFIKES